MITVTLNQIKKSNPCTDGWKKVLKANGGTSADMDKPFPLGSILDSNDLDDTLWVISNVEEMREFHLLWREFSCWCALQNIEKIKPYCSDDDYDLITQWLTHRDSSAAESAARSAAESAAESAARLEQEEKLRQLLRDN